MRGSIFNAFLHTAQGGNLAETLGGRIKAYREALGLSQERLAEAAKVGQGSISRWEDNQFEPRASELQRLAAALGLNIHYLIAGEGPEAPPGAAGGLSRDSGARSAIMRIRMALDDLEALTVGAGAYAIAVEGLVDRAEAGPPRPDAEAPGGRHDAG